RAAIADPACPATGARMMHPAPRSWPQGSAPAPPAVAFIHLCRHLDYGLIQVTIQLANVTRHRGCLGANPDPSYHQHEKDDPRQPFADCHPRSLFLITLPI
ncbi:hypothetical protein, partial [Phaeobacter gallaeciensis]|uniref:hypothetical protein n=1 Tax=Phaeobacter gallaeciensis TaxID=60890 RepID=UPI001C6882E0